MDILIKVGQLVLSLSILIVLHELGHFLPAKWFKTRVEKFYLFFDPWFSLFKKKVGETEYGVGWLPLGGYVKISGMIDESFDTEQMKEPPKPWEFRSKAAWQRLIIMLGGVTVNFILGFFLYAMILFTWGEDYLLTKNLKYGVVPDSIGMELGIQKGDKVLMVGDYQLEKYNPGIFKTEVIINGAREFTVERNGGQQKIQISDEAAKKLSKYENKDYSLYAYRFPFIVGGFSKESPAKEAGIQKTDQIISLNGTATPFYDDFINLLTKPPKKGQEVTVGLLRETEGQSAKDTVSLTFTTTKDGYIGVAALNDPVAFFDMEHKDYSFLESIPAGTKKGWDFLGNQVAAFGKMFKGDIDASDSLGSFITIGAMFPSTWDWQRFWQMTAFLSLILAFINLLPIPALDGGHVMFLLFEVLTGKKPSDKVMEYSTMAGFVILIGIMVYALGLDISRLL